MQKNSIRERDEIGLRDRDLTIHQHGKQPVTELRKLLVFLLK